MSMKSPMTPKPQALMGEDPNPLQYSSAQTRFSSLDKFRGDVQLSDYSFQDVRLELNSSDCQEDLEVKFNSRVCRGDLPTRYSQPEYDRYLGDRKLKLSDDYDGFFRVRGAPVGKG